MGASFEGRLMEDVWHLGVGVLGALEDEEDEEEELFCGMGARGGLCGCMVGCCWRGRNRKYKRREIALWETKGWRRSGSVHQNASRQTHIPLTQ